MDRLFGEKTIRWMLPVMLILFILEIVTLPLVLGFTYSGRSEAPDHVLTYSAGKLTWDSATGIAPNGSAILNLFDYVYDGAESDDGENIVAPGTEGFNIVRLKNNVSGKINYTTVLYRIDDSEKIPVEASLYSAGVSNAATYPLPAGVRGDQVIRAISGSVSGGAAQDFDISWLWHFFVDSAQDGIDTDFGNKPDLDEITLGLYIVVEDNNSYITPESPKTGDDSGLAIYATLMAISLVMLVLLVLEWRKRRVQEELSAEDIA